MKRFERITCPECGRPDISVSWVNDLGYYGVYQHRERLNPMSPWCFSAGRSYRPDSPREEPGDERKPQ